MILKLFQLIQIVKAVRAFKRRRAVLKGKLTYTMLIGILASVLSRVLGFEVSDGDLQPLAETVMTLIAFYGRWRATKE